MCESININDNIRNQRTRAASSFFFSPSIPNDLEGAANNNNNNNQHARAAAAIVQYIVGRNNSNSSRRCRRGDEDASFVFSSFSSGCFSYTTICLGFLSPTGSRRTLSRYLWLESRLKAFLLLFLLPISQVKRTYTTKTSPKTSYFHFVLWLKRQRSSIFLILWFFFFFFVLRSGGQMSHWQGYVTRSSCDCTDTRKVCWFISGR